jgi:hypothetical protein
MDAGRDQCAEAASFPCSKCELRKFEHPSLTSFGSETDLATSEAGKSWSWPMSKHARTCRDIRNREGFDLKSERNMKNYHRKVAITPSAPV